MPVFRVAAALFRRGGSRSCAVPYASRAGRFVSGGRVVPAAPVPTLTAFPRPISS